MLPRLGKSTLDGMYPRCVYCCGENWAMLVWRYSHREVPCAASSGCGRYLPAEYVIVVEQSGEEVEG